MAARPSSGLSAAPQRPPSRPGRQSRRSRSARTSSRTAAAEMQRRRDERRERPGACRAGHVRAPSKSSSTGAAAGFPTLATPGPPTSGKNFFSGGYALPPTKIQQTVSLSWAAAVIDRREGDLHAQRLPRWLRQPPRQCQGRGEVLQRKPRPLLATENHRAGHGRCSAATSPGLLQRAASGRGPPGAPVPQKIAAHPHRGSTAPTTTATPTTSPWCSSGAPDRLASGPAPQRSGAPRHVSWVPQPVRSATAGRSAPARGEIPRDHRQVRLGPVQRWQLPRGEPRERGVLVQAIGPAGSPHRKGWSVTVNAA